MLKRRRERIALGVGLVFGFCSVTGVVQATGPHDLSQPPELVAAVPEERKPPGSEEKTGYLTAEQVAAMRGPNADLKDQMVVEFEASATDPAARVRFEALYLEYMLRIGVSPLGIPVAPPPYKATTAVPVGSLAPSEVAGLPAVVAGDPAPRLLSVTQYGQQRGNWCGPATVYMMMKYKGITLSAYNSNHTLSQTTLSTGDYTNAGMYGGTDWVDFDMRRAVNRWRFGDENVGYEQVTPSSTTHLMTMTMIDIQGYEPLAADMVEVYGGLHYNYHPNRAEAIYHWTAGYGYWYGSGYGDLVYFKDPATTVWPNVQPSFILGIADTYYFMTANAQRGVVW